MELGKKIGIFGGTFDPIHIGHLILAQTALSECGLDEILFLPSGGSYMKENVSNKSHRLQMTKLAIEDNPDFKISTLETDRTGNSYSYETLLFLTKNNPKMEYFFIIGADTLFSIEYWKNPEQIMECVTLLVALRPGFDHDKIQNQIILLQNKYQAKIKLLVSKNIEISSTDIRNKVRDGLSIKYLVTENVLTYIKDNDIYKG